MMNIYVEYHDDGGQMCVPARKKCRTREEAEYWGKLSDAWGGTHYCQDSWGIFETDENLLEGKLSCDEAQETQWGVRWRGTPWVWG